MPAVYDDEKTSEDQLRDITGINKADEKAIDARAHNDFASDEEKGANPDPDIAANKEKEKLNDQLGSGYTGKEKSTQKKSRSKNGKKKKGIIAGILVSAAVGAGGLGILSAPTLIVNHLRELMLGKVSSLQLRHTRRYRQKNFPKIKNMFTKDGRRANKLIDDMKLRGYEPRFSPSDGKTLLGFDLPGGRLGTAPGLGTIEEIEGFLETKHPLKSARWKTKQMNAVYKKLGIPRKSVVIAAESLDEAADTIVNKRMADTVIPDDEVKTESTGKNAVEGEDDAAKQSRESINNEARNIIENDGSLDGLKKELKAGTKVSDLTPDQRTVLRVGLDFDDELIDLLNNFSKVGIGQRLMNGIKGMFASAVTDLMGKICTIKSRLSAAIFAARVYRARALLQYASIFVSASDQTRAGGVDSKMMNELFKRVTSLDGSKRPIGGSAGFAYMMHGKFSKSQNDAGKTAYGVDGSLTGVAKGVNDTVNDIPGTDKNKCRVWQSPITQVGAAVVELGVGFLSGGSGKAASVGLKETIGIAFKDMLKSVFTKKTLGLVAVQITAELTFEGAMSLLQIQAQKALSLNFHGQEKGGDLGDIIAGGAGAMNKQRSLASGMVPATTEQYAQAQAEFIAWKKEQKKNQSFYARMFDYNNTDSAIFNVASAAVTLPMTPETMGAALSNNINKLANILSNPTILFGSVSSIVFPKAFAQSSDEISFDTFDVKGTSLATDPAGNLLPIMRTDIENIDPIKNIDSLIASGDIQSTEPYEPLSNRFKEHLKNCVETTDGFTALEQQDDTPKPEDDCLAKLDITKKFKAHLAYLDMVDGVDAWLFPEDLAISSQVVSSTGGSGIPPTPGKKATKEVDTSGLSCAGTPSKERIVEIAGGTKRKLCDYGSVQNVDASWSVNVSAMLAAANGQVSLGGSGFRTADSQINLRKKHCGTSHYDIYEKSSSSCSPPTARPGTSNHELGLAIDFSNCSTRSSACYRWLSANASKYGVINLPSESWHWSIDGK